MKQCVWTCLYDMPPIRTGRAVINRYALGCDPNKTHWRPPHWEFCPCCGATIIAKLSDT